MAQDQLLLSDGASRLLLSDGVSVLLLSTSTESGPPAVAVRRFYNLTSEATYPLSSRTTTALTSRVSYRS